MNQLTLEWVEAGQVKTQTIGDRQSSKHPGTFRIGRDPAKCDLVMTHPTVSKLHVEIFFGAEQRTFYLRNLREANPPLVDQKRLTQGVTGLHQGATIMLGDLEIRVKSVSVLPVLAPTFVTPQHPAANHHPVAQAASPQAVASPAATMPYGLECPKCHHVSSYDHLETGCAWCGTSLAAAQSVLLVPE
ncbi:FHA domain-containing protein [Egbenema bharatensis]|uniref:FHA domain-containing protein n=1 Tax=Egbenema bharatensis TaxID=3463334 RepID=UPI003A89926D